MNIYVLDTDICIYWLNGKAEIRNRVSQLGAERLKITMITLAELRYGAYNSQKKEENLKNIDKFLKKAGILSLNNSRYAAGRRFRPRCHSCESRNLRKTRIPAFAGMTGA